MNTDDVLLYFLSGTGNTYRTAQWMAEAARSQGATARVIPIDAANPKIELAGESTAGSQLVGLLAPTHAFTAPWAMISFALRLPRGRGQAAFSTLTRAGMRVGRWIAPGLEGSGAYLLVLILALKGYRVVGARGLDLPVSWTALAPGCTRETAEMIMARARPQAEHFIADLLAGKRRFLSLVSLVLGILLLPLSCAYLVMGRFFLAKLFYASSKCNGCGLCAQSCPVKAIKMAGPRKRRFPYWTFLCESCTRCMNFCPKQAVEASYPLGALMIFLANIPLAALLIDAGARWVFQTTGLSGGWIDTLLTYPLQLAAIAVAYLVFTLVLRIPITNRLLTLLTPTHYYHRYQAPGANLKDMTR